MSGMGLQSFASVLIVLGLVAALAWFARRGAFHGLRPGAKSMSIETAMPLGERRSLVIVSVEGRRLLLGLTPTTVAMVTELAAPSFEKQLDAKS
jgi:flagellar protein FliO/FliZ